MSTEHVDPCWGGHIPSVTCEEATAAREAEERGLFYCSESPSQTHMFTGATVCDYGCGRYLQELIPDAPIPEAEEL